VPGGRRAEHPVADDQEVHDGIIPRPADGETGARQSEGCRAPVFNP
jgi:hypothetical protein